MIKKDKLYLLIFIFSVNSILVSIILKLLGVNIFNVSNYSFEYPVIGFAIKLLILLTQYFLIVGCVTCYPPKRLFFKMLPYLPLTIILYYLPENYYSLINPVILFVTCLALIPKFKTILSFIINSVFIMLIQLLIIWLRLDIRAIAPVFPDTLQFAIMNIDQLIILSLLYFINRKRGDIYGMVFSGRKK
jgi:hypothetical protein